MTDHDVRDFLERMAAEEPVPFLDAEPLARRARRRAARTVIVGALGVAAAIAAVFTGASQIRTAPVPADTPAPVPGVMREEGEVLRFTGRTEPDILSDGSSLEREPGDLVAVDPRTGEQRVLVEDLDAVYSASWSADGRWLAYETDGTDGVGRDLWVAGGSQAPRLVPTGGNPIVNLAPSDELAWMWSPTGTNLATIDLESETLRTIDFATGETTDLGPAVADLLQPAGVPWPTWSWSSDGTHLVFGSPGLATDGSLYSIDVGTGERSLLARLPHQDVRTDIIEIRWSPDGTHIAVATGGGDHIGGLYVLNADGSDVRLVADDSDSLGFAWSPDGTRLAFGEEEGREVRIRVSEADGAAPAEIGGASLANCLRTSWGGSYKCSVAWSPDGTQVALRKGETGEVTVFDGAGAGEARSLDELTFISWDGGWYRTD